MDELDIGEVIRRTGLPASTLRYYEERGLIEAIGRRGLRRQFAPAVVERLAFITLGRAVGFSLDDLAGMVGPGGRPAPDRALLAAKADELTARIDELTAAREALRHAAECPAPSHLECPTFQRLLAAAAAGTLRPAEGAAYDALVRSRSGE